MRIKLKKNEYTQLNTSDVSFIIQNISNSDIGLIKSYSKPSNDDMPDIVLKPYDGVNDNIMNGIFWGKASIDGLEVGVVE